MSLPQCNNDSEILVFYDTQGISYIYHRTFIARGPKFEIVTVNQIRKQSLMNKINRLPRCRNHLL